MFDYNNLKKDFDTIRSSGTSKEADLQKELFTVKNENHNKDNTIKMREAEIESLKEGCKQREKEIDRLAGEFNTLQKG